jgi:hypothetical protein
MSDESERGIERYLDSVGESESSESESSVPMPSFRGSYSGLPGTPGCIEVGRKMVCPIDPGHYSAYVQVRGEILYCPHHMTELVQGQ